VAEHLLGLGHRRIACLSSRETPTQTWAVKRRSSFEAAVLRCKGARVKSWHLNEQGSNGVEVARELLTDELQPTAVFAVSDHEASAVHRAAAELGLTIPQQLSLVGFADLDFAASMDPPLTTMRQKPYEIGHLAANLIMERNAGGVEDDGEPTTIKVAAELIVRGSTSTPRSNP
jgi:LacI family transcriptional regulator